MTTKAKKKAIMAVTMVIRTAFVSPKSTTTSFPGEVPAALSGAVRQQQSEAPTTVGVRRQHRWRPEVVVKKRKTVR
jgi:hypothetical protein